MAFRETITGYLTRNLALRQPENTLPPSPHPPNPIRSGGPALCQLMETQLVLADGRVFRGLAFGARLPRSGDPSSDPRFAVGEVVFNTSMTGYQEILTDPSYCGQIVVMTQPLIGNYGVNPEDVESRDGRIWPVGFAVREAAEHWSNPHASGGLSAYLADHGVVGIQEIDTRALTRRLRDRGAMAGALAPGDADPDEVLDAVRAWGSMEGRHLIDEVAPSEPYRVAARGKSRFRVAAYDFGAKQSIFRRMAELGIEVRVFPAATPPEELLAVEPDGVFLSNGPGDPATCVREIEAVRKLLGEKPMFGICLGHQLLALALGATTYKLPFGHHGGNQPVQDTDSGRIEITAQNHGFAVDEESLVAHGGVVTHLNLNDGSVEGFSIPRKKAFAIQYHPEAAPGPHDAHHHFERLVRLLERG
jgi:carbamoyl-phosphate synthase small subunit